MKRTFAEVVLLRHPRLSWKSISKLKGSETDFRADVLRFDTANVCVRLDFKCLKASRTQLSLILEKIWEAGRECGFERRSTCAKPGDAAESGKGFQSLQS